MQRKFRIHSKFMMEGLGADIGQTPPRRRKKSICLIWVNIAEGRLTQGLKVLPIE
jgi:hypothetical protein